jgi:aminoglycoside phosphotransferase (APT) family kinase protein
LLKLCTSIKVKGENYINKLIRVGAQMIDINVDLVKKLIANQFPQWSKLPISPVEKGGVDNRTFHLGSDMSVRLPSGEGYAPQVEKEHMWVPKFKQHIHLPISEPIAKGEPGEGYPWSWSVYKWIEGFMANTKSVKDMNQFARDLSRFLIELEAIDTSGGPPAGIHNYFRGASPVVYDEETRAAIKNTRDIFDEVIVTEIWNKALESQWSKHPVWVHGDVAPGNLLVNSDGKLSAVIDFGVLGVGDPACDLAMAWTFFDHESREVFKSSMNLDEETWDRGRGWALWKSLITYDAHRNNAEISMEMIRIINIIINEFKETK